MGAGPRSGCVLVVDDDFDTRAMLRLSLELEGYTVVEAGHGAEAMEQLRVGLRPAVIVLDLRMPVMDGYEFCAAQRDDPECAAIPVLALTGDPRFARGAEKLVVAGYLRKPLEVKELVAAVGRLAQRAD